MENNMQNNSPASKSFVERLAENLGGAANAARIYGEPIERNGTTVIPVAKASYGFGGGGGKKEGQEGTGGGGGMSLTPVGYIEIKDCSSRFKSIRDPQNVMKIVAISGLFAFMIMKSVTKLVKR